MSGFVNENKAFSLFNPVWINISASFSKCATLAPLENYIMYRKASVTSLALDEVSLFYG